MDKNKRYFNNLDASRFFAFIIVFLAHAFITKSVDIKNSDSFQFIYNWGKIGVLGVEYFFVLSSFLISWVILEEKASTKNFNIKNFLIRRALRVLPLYFFIVALGFIFAGLSYLYHVPINSIPKWYNFILFIINFYIIEQGSNFLFFLVFLWPISIEEQFYIFYSIVIKYIKINLVCFAFFLIAVSLVFRFFYLNESDQLYFNTFSALGNFGIGGIAAYISFHKTSVFSFLIKQKKIVNVIFYLVLILSIVFFHQLNSYKIFTLFSRLYFSILFGYYILEQSFGENRLFNPSKNKLLNYLGKISYGLYCFHGVIITLLIKGIGFLSYSDSLLYVYLVYPLSILVLTIAIAHLSFVYFESKFLKLKNKFYTFDNN